MEGDLHHHLYTVNIQILDLFLSNYMVPLLLTILFLYAIWCLLTRHSDIYVGWVPSCHVVWPLLPSETYKTCSWFSWKTYRLYHQIYIFKVLYFETKLLTYIKTGFRMISWRCLTIMFYIVYLGETKVKNSSTMLSLES